MGDLTQEKLNSCYQNKSNKEKVIEEECETCGGSGFVTTMERVYPNEPHMAPIGEEPCPDCNDKGVDEDYV